MVSERRPRFAVLGGGHGGKTMAAHLALKGFSVNLYKRRSADLEQLRKEGGIHLTGAIQGFGKLNLASSNIEEVIDDVDVIMVVVPAHVHKSLAESCAPYLHDGQIILLNPGRTGGALEFRNILNKNGVTAKVMVAEAQTLVYTCRSAAPTSSEVFSVKSTVPIAAFPASETESVLKAVTEAYPQFVPATSILETSLNNFGAVLHPTLLLLNSGTIQAMQGKFKIYVEGATAYICKVIETVDKERVNLARAFNVKTSSVKDWLSQTYGVKGESLFETLQNNLAYKEIYAPPSLEHRYILEDVPTGLVPFASLGNAASVPTPTISALVNLASAMFDTDFGSRGRTVETLGLAGLGVEEIKQLIMRGHTPRI